MGNLLNYSVYIYIYAIGITVKWVQLLKIKALVSSILAGVKYMSSIIVCWTIVRVLSALI